MVSLVELFHTYTGSTKVLRCTNCRRQAFSLAREGLLVCRDKFNFLPLAYGIIQLHLKLDYFSYLWHIWHPLHISTHWCNCWFFQHNCSQGWNCFEPWWIGWLGYIVSLSREMVHATLRLGILNNLQGSASLQEEWCICWLLWIQSSCEESDLLVSSPPINASNFPPSSNWFKFIYWNSCSPICNVGISYRSCFPNMGLQRRTFLHSCRHRSTVLQ